MTYFDAYTNNSNKEEVKTPCEEKGWKVGDRFRVLKKYEEFKVGDIIELVQDDGSVCPFFSADGDNNIIRCMYLHEVEKIEDEEEYKYLNSLAPIEEHNDVWHPSHYTQGSIECIDAIKAALTPAEFKGFLKGQVMKYTWRMGLKGSVLVDAQKAKWYMDTLNEELEEE